MKMERVIRERRLALGMTQEQVADALGVTAPAVNKWEKGASCPDLGLLCPLARLLGIDVNELLGFRENLSDEETQRLAMEVIRIADEKGLDAGFERMRELMREYPNSGYLAYTGAVLLQAKLTLNASGEARDEHQAQIDAWLELAADCDDARVRDRVREVLAARYIQREDWDAAQRVIDAMPECPGMDRRAAQANLYQRQGKYEEAAKLLQGVLYASVSEVCTTLQLLTTVELALGEQEDVERLSRVLEEAVKLFDLWPFIGLAAAFQCATSAKDAPRALSAMRELLAALDEPWRPGDSPLYRRISPEKPGTLNERIWPALLTDFETNPDFDFLRGEAEFEETLSKYRDRANAGPRK